MQVRKFEATTMQEALKLVKSELGPEAIILSARDNSSGYGLLHQASVEITAAIPERSLHKKKYFESRLKEVDQIRFKGSTARVQKQLIDHAVNRYTEKTDAASKKSIRRAKYASITDDEVTAPKIQETLTPQAPPSQPIHQTAHSRIRNAVQAAWSAGREVVPPTPSPAPPRAPAQLPEVFQGPGRDVEILSLKQEIARLRELLVDIKQVKPTEPISSHPLASYGLPYEMIPAQERLRAAGLDKEIIINILKDALVRLGPEKSRKRPLVEAFAAQWILDQTQVSPDPFGGRIHLFVGPSGSGKTSTLVKYASHLVLSGKKSVAVLTSDLKKVGAAEQLKIFCKILNVPFAALRSGADWPYLLEQLGSVDHILVDGPGTSLRQMEDIGEAKSFLPPQAESFATHLVLPATLRDRDGYELAQRFKILKVKDLIFSHLDQSSQHGIIFNVQKKMNLPLNSFGLGPQIPEDFEVATKERVLDLLYKLSQLKSGRIAHG